MKLQLTLSLALLLSAAPTITAQDGEPTSREQAALAEEQKLLHRQLQRLEGSIELNAADLASPKAPCALHLSSLTLTLRQLHFNKSHSVQLILIRNPTGSAPSLMSAQACPGISPRSASSSIP